MTRKENKIKKLLSKKSRPLSGQNRPFSLKATKRKFYGNIQKIFKVGKKNYRLTARIYRSISKIASI